MSTLTGDVPFQQLLEAVTDYAIFMLDLEGRVASWNAGAEKAKGYTLEEILGRHFSIFYTPEDREAGRPARILDTVLREGRFEDEGWRLRKDGTRFWANVVITLLRDSAGQPSGFAKITRDLTQRRQDEEALRQSEERFHHLVDAVTDYAILLLDESGRVKTWNEGAKRLKGYDASEIIGRSLDVFYTEAARVEGRPEANLDRVRREGRHAEQDWRVRKDGSRFWADVVITALRDGEGRTVGFAKVTRDLSERRAAEEALRRSEEGFRLLVANLREHAMFMLDPTGCITSWNLGAERMTGYTGQEILGQPFSVFFPQDDVASGKPSRELAHASEHGSYEDNAWRLRKDGTRFWANLVTTAIRSDRGELLGFGKVLRDLTKARETAEAERHLFEEQAARTAAENVAARAEETNRMRDQFLATVSHELRTPLNAIVGWAAMLDSQEPSPPMRRAIGIINRNSRSLVKLVEDILDVSRLMTGKLKLNPVELDLVAIAREAVEAVRPAADAKRQTLEFAPTEAPLGLSGDPDRLQQVLWNLLSNAVKFTPDRGRVSLSLEQDATGRAVIRVEDDGRGIDPRFLPHVFERFRQADASSTRQVGGIGLGLALSKSIVELHGGTIEAESAGLGEGSRFVIRIPVRGAAAPPTDTTEASVLPPPTSGELKGLRILVVEDDEDSRELFATALEKAGAEVEAVDSTAAAIVSVGQFKPHVLVSDIGMPHEDGYALMRRVRAIPVESGGGIPGIALTAYTRQEDKANALAAGFSAHVAKPVIPSDLIEAVRRLALTVG